MTPVQGLLTGVLLALPALSVSSHKDAASGAVAVSAWQEPIEDKHFMANTYGFLRSTSDNVGDAAKGVMGIQDSLDAMRRDLSSEYATWMRKKQAMVQENDRLRSSIARFQAERQKQASMQELKLRLEAELANRREDTRKILEDNYKSGSSALMNEENLKGDIASLEKMVSDAIQVKALKAAMALNATNSLREHNAKQQEKVLEENKKVQDLQTKLGDVKTEAGKVHTKLLQEIDGVQAQVDAFQAKLVEQAKVKQEVEAYRRRIAAQMEQIVLQKKNTAALKADCVKSKAELEQRIGGAKEEIAKGNAIIRQCQDMDAHNQKLRTDLNACLAAKKSPR